jgi:hypothetical protein
MRSGPEDVRMTFRILKKGTEGNLKAVWECERREREVTYKVKNLRKLVFVTSVLIFYAKCFYTKLLRTFCLTVNPCGVKGNMINIPLKS